MLEKLGGRHAAEIETLRGNRSAGSLQAPDGGRCAEPAFPRGAGRAARGVRRVARAGLGERFWLRGARRCDLSNPAHHPLAATREDEV